MANDILSLFEMKAIWDKGEDTFGMVQEGARIGFEKGRIAEAEKHDAMLAAVNCVCKPNANTNTG